MDWIEDRLVSFGYLPSEQDGLYTAGFRADYWMAPSITVTEEDDVLKVHGPSFYLRKLQKAYRRKQWLSRARTTLSKVRKRSE